MKHKRAAILTRQFGMKNLKDNEIYQTDICEKIVYPTKSDLTEAEKEQIKADFQILVKSVSPDVNDPFSLIVSDLKNEKLPSTGRVPNYISVECGPTVTGPLYSPESNIRPVDILFLTRYLGPVRPDALGPKFSTVNDISKSYDLMSSYKEDIPETKAQWIFEQWNKKVTL
jgi:hypothetical protein